MSQTCPTIKIVSPEAPGGFVIINESDRKPEHEIWADVPKSDDKEDVTESNQSRPSLNLTQPVKKTR